MNERLNERFCTSLEVSKKLKESGFPQRGCYAYWNFYPEVKHKGWEERWKFSHYNMDGHERYGSILMTSIAAPCVGRLGEELAEYDGDWYSEPYEGIWYCRLQNSCTRRIESDTEADARALIWIELKKKGLL